MPWTKTQKQIAVMAGRQAGLDEDMRKLILRQFPNAFNNRAQGPALNDGDSGGRPHPNPLPGGEGERDSGGPSSTSPRLNNADFERFMAIVEDRAGGRILHFTPGYWQDKAGSRSAVANERMGAKIRALYRDYQAQDSGGGRYRLDGLVWRFSGGRTSKVEELKPKEAWNLIEMLKALVAKRGPVPEAKPSALQERLFSERELPGLTQGLRPGSPKTPTAHPALAHEEIPF